MPRTIRSSLVAVCLALALTVGLVGPTAASKPTDPVAERPLGQVNMPWVSWDWLTFSVHLNRSDQAAALYGILGGAWAVASQWCNTTGPALIPCKWGVGTVSGIVAYYARQYGGSCDDLVITYYYTGQFHSARCVIYTNGGGGGGDRGWG